MTTHSMTLNHSTEVGSAKGILDQAIRTLSVWYDRFQGRRQLAALEDWRLADIGVDRNQARAEAAKPFWRV